MALILNIDTSTGKAGICLSKEGHTLLQLENRVPKEHASWLHPAVRTLLQETGYRIKDLQAIALAAGPGSYTGLRVGMAAAKGFCYAGGLPLITENTLKVMALAAGEQVPEQGLLCPMIDARRSEVFTALYEKDGSEIKPPTAMIIDENSFAEYLSTRRVSFFGEGSYKCKQLISAPGAAFIDVGWNVGHLGILSFSRYLQRKFTGVAYSEPAYTKEFYTHTRK